MVRDVAHGGTETTDTLVSLIVRDYVGGAQRTSASYSKMSNRGRCFSGDTNHMLSGGSANPIPLASSRALLRKH